MTEPIFFFALHSTQTDRRNIASMPQGDVAKFENELRSRPIEVEHRLVLQQSEADYFRQNLTSRLQEYQRANDGWYSCSHEVMQSLHNAAVAQARDAQTNMDVAEWKETDRHYAEKFLGSNAYTTDIDFWLSH